MKSIVKYLVFTFLLLAISKASFASTLNGTINFSGAGSVTPGVGITFTAPPSGGQAITAPSASGDFTGYKNGQNVNFKNNFTFAGISKVGGEQLFSVTSKDGLDQLKFVVTSYSYNTTTGTYTFYGTLTETGSVNAQNKATLVYTNSGQNTNTFSASLTTAPEPSSLVLLGTGLVTAAGMMLRRRRVV